MNRNKNLLRLYNLYYKFPNEQKKVFHAFSFQLCSTENSKFPVKVSEYLFFLKSKNTVFLHKTHIEKPYWNLHFKFHGFFFYEITEI